jgi:flagellar hook-length control protein FliK
VEPALAPALPSFAAEWSRAQPAAGGAKPNPAATELTLPMPVTAPEFVPRLSGELAILARDGVQEARVNVHPVELGPISVQIAVDGSTAQVHLAVDSAQTRELLERAMPTLAAALRDSGLTLTGGGVFQQPRQSPREPSADNPQGRAAGRGRLGEDRVNDVATPAGPAAARRWRQTGTLDVFA